MLDRFFSKMTEYASENKAIYDKGIAMMLLHSWGGDTDITDEIITVGDDTALVS